MAIKRGSKVETSFGAASMTDLMFLLLIFFMVATTLINTNALKVALPKSSNQVDEKPKTTLTITSELIYFIDKRQVSFDQILPTLQETFKGVDKPVLSVAIDKSVAVEELVKIMDMAKKNNFNMYINTKP